MLRMALDAAEGRQQQQEFSHFVQCVPGENSGLLYQQQAEIQQDDSALTPVGSESGGYGTASHTTTAEGEFHEDDEEGSGSIDASYGDEDDWSYSHQQQHAQPGIARKTWEGIRSAFMLVANVENLWDSPVPSTNGNVRVNGGSSTNTELLRRRSYLIVLFWFFILAGAYAAERSTFKLLVDRAGPFRLFSVEMVTASHALMLGLWLALSSIYHHRQANNQESSRMPLGIPLVDVGYMALLDTFHLLLVFLTGRHVCPTLTVILVQFTLPLSCLLTQFVSTDGKCACRPRGDDDDDDDNSNTGFNERDIAEDHGFGSYHHEHANQNHSTTIISGAESSENQSAAASEGIPLPGWGGLSAEHLWGSLILSLAVLLALLPSFYSIINPQYFTYADQLPTQIAYNTLLYVSSCFPAAASQLYKEHVFLQNKQPVNASYLNFLLSLFQLILASVMAPLVFGLQGLGAGSDWTALYPSSHFSKNFLAGFKCFFGMLPDDAAENDFPEPALCRWSLPLVLMHAFSIIAVGCAVDKIVNAGATKAMYRGISAGIIVAVLLMYEYDMHIPRFNYGPVIDALNLVCLILLVVGAEVYHRVSLSDSVFETVYPAVEGLYEDE